ncbi:hypothetical protein [Alistipes sp.]|uniref:hypothetical protein n=1 Tax=Alistipes sp. TaxID=1872444 RepID=UPI003AAC7E89
MKRDRQLIERFWALRRSVRFSSTETVLYLALVRLCRVRGGRRRSSAPMPRSAARRGSTKARSCGHAMR